MNAGDLMAKIEANKKPLAIAGAAGVAGLALLQRKKAGGDVGGVSAGAAPVGAGSGSGLAAPSGQVVYSSEASDVYNALQGPLATVSTGVSQLLADRAAAAADTAIPMASPGLVRDLGNGRVYQYDGKNIDWLSPGELKAIGGATPNIQQVAKDSTFWSSVTRIDAKDAANPGR